MDVADVPVPRAAPAAPGDPEGNVPDGGRTPAEDRPFAFGADRLVFFSDAVFAIAITLLAIDLRLPELPPGQTDATFLRALGDLWPEIFAFVVSFFVIAAFWVGHNRTFTYIVAVDGRLVAINFLFLFCIASLPFPTSMIATQGDLPSAVAIYAGWVMVTGLLAAALWIYAARVGHLVSPVLAPALVRSVSARAAVIPIVFAISIVVGLAAPALAWTLWLLAAPIQAVVTRWLLPRFGG